MKKKILAILTVAICFAGVMPVNAAAENSDEGIVGLQEEGGSSLISGEQSVGVYVDYFSELSEISETAEADTAKLIIDESYSSDIVSSSCTIKSLGRDLTIDAGDNDIIILLDEAVLEKTVTVKADKGSVTFFLQGSLVCGKESKGIVWHEICDGCKITDDKYIPICFYGSEDSVITLNDETVLCGSLRLPYTVLDDRSSGAFNIEYVSEYDNKAYAMKPSIIGNVLLKKLMNDEIVFAFCYGKAETGDVYAEPEYRIVKLPDKVEYNLGEMIDLKGLEIEVTKANEDPVVYSYPDVAFDYQSNIPKAPRVILHSDFRSDKAETYKVEVVGADNVCFDVEVVDEEIIAGTIKATVLDINENSLLLQSVSNCYERYLLYNGQIKGDIKPTVGMSLEIAYEGGMFNLVPIMLFGNVKKVSAVSEKTEFLRGDTNCDGGVDMADAVLIMQALANPNKYGEFNTEFNYLTALGRLNGDMNGDGLTVGDAQAIQRKLLGLSDDENKQTDQNGTTDNNDLERTGDLLKQFVAEQKDNGNSAFRLANVYSQEELKDIEGSIPEPYSDKIVVEYYHPNREKFLESVHEFMENNNISEELVLFVELQ